MKLLCIIHSYFNQIKLKKILKFNNKFLNVVEESKWHHKVSIIRNLFMKLIKSTDVFLLEMK